MKSLSELQTHYNSDSLTTCDCWLVVLRDGVTIGGKSRLGFTDHPEDLTIDGDLYEGNVGFDRTATEVKNSLGADNHKLLGVIDSVRITREDIQGRRFEGAVVYHFSVDYTNPGGTKDKHGYGFLGEITLRGNIWEAEFTSLSTVLERELLETRSPYCRVALGSPRCGVTLNPDAWTSVVTVAVGDVVRNPTPDGLRHVYVSAGVTSTAAPAFASIVGSSVSDGTATLQAAEAFFHHFSVTSVIDRRTFVASVLGGAASSWFQHGTCLFSTGDNAGYPLQVKQHTSTGQVEVIFDFPFTVANGDEGSLTAGCNHKLKDVGDVAGASYTGHCRTKFYTKAPGTGNAANFQGDPEIPGIDQLLGGDTL